MGSLYAKDVVDIALGEVGYQCGENKWNKYAEDLDSVDYFTGCGPKQNLDFCAVGLCWCLWKAAKYPSCEEDGESAKWTAHYFSYQSDICDMAAVVKYLYQYFDDNNATTDNGERGDFVIFQKSNGVMYHCGILTSWDNDGLDITEFNTEGGKVKTHRYSYTDIGVKIKCFCRPRYDGWEEGQSSSGQVPVKDESSSSHVLTDAVINDLAHRCIEGEFGNFPLRKQKINALGYGPIYSLVQNRVNMIIYGR